MDENSDVEVPQFFLCPISLQIMHDPVTTATGITYDRESIEHWIFTRKSTTCPVTKQVLPKDSGLTPNHTLRRLIQAWCTDHGIVRIPTPKPCLEKFQVMKLIEQLNKAELQMEALEKLESLAAEHERNRKCMAAAGVPRSVLLFVINCYNNHQTEGLHEAFSILGLVPFSSSEASAFLIENIRIIESLTWILGCILNNQESLISQVVITMKILLEDAFPKVLERLKPEFFDRIVAVLKERSKLSKRGLNSALELLLNVAPHGRNRVMMVESGTVSELIEIELESPEKRTTELILGILFHQCTCADGRAKLLSHGAGVAVVAKRMLKVSPAADERAVLILSLICKFSGTNVVLQELLEVKAVSKLCMLLQIECPSYLKEKARDILRLHSEEWKNSPCIHTPPFTCYPN